MICNELTEIRELLVGWLVITKTLSWHAWLHVELQYLYIRFIIDLINSSTCVRLPLLLLFIFFSFFFFFFNYHCFIFFFLFLFFFFFCGTDWLGFPGWIRYEAKESGRERAWKRTDARDTSYYLVSKIAKF